MTKTPLVDAPADGRAGAAPVYSEIAVPVDFTSLGWRVLPLAEQLAYGFRAPIRLLHVDTSSPWSDSEPELLRLRATPFRRTVQVEVVPDPDVALGLGRALTGRNSLVVMGTHAYTGASEVFLDSSMENILRSVDGPVVLCGPRLRGGRVPLTNIVCCVDRGDPPAVLLQDVTAWARHLRIGVELLTVLPKGSIGEGLDEMREQERRLEMLSKHFSHEGLDVAPIVLRGSRPGHEIVDYVNGAAGTVVALATHARHASTRAVVGSVGMKIVRHAEGPVLVRRRDS